MTPPNPEVPLVTPFTTSSTVARTGRMPPEPMGRMKKQQKEKSNLHAEEDLSENLESMNLDSRLSKLMQKYHEVFPAWPPPLSPKLLVQMDLKLKPEVEGSVVRRRPYPAQQDHVDEIKGQMQECIDAGLVEEYNHADYPRHRNPCFTRG